jgi:uncharacterized membrane protein
VSSSHLWLKGKHQSRHNGGVDLTESILNAPHSEAVLSRFQVIGELFEEETTQSKFVNQMQKLHLHPIAVHFSIAYSIAAFLLALLYLITGTLSLETASYYLLVLGLLSAPVSALAGLFSWRTTYKSKRNKIFTWKLIFAAIFLTIITICFLLRAFYPQILISKTYVSFLYVSLLTSLTPTVTILGYYGGKIVYD